MEKHFVVFYSPGTFVAEQDLREIDSWDVDRAVEMADTILQRHNATPYGFRFKTRSRGENDLDSHESASSPMYYLGGEIQTLEELKEKNEPGDNILIRNMENNGWNRVITNTNSWEMTQPLHDDDIVLDYIPPNKREKKVG